MKDTLFFNPKKALAVAKEQNQIETIPGHPVKSLQICYYIGEKLKDENITKNCIHIELENLYNYFVTTKNRFPTHFDLESTEFNAEEATYLTQKIISVLDAAKEERKNLINIYIKNILEQEPNFNDEKIRVFIPTIREATVIKHVSQNLSEAFLEKEVEVFFYLPDELGDQNLLPKLHYLYEFNPHIIITIDFIENKIINDKCFYFCWMQDPMAILTNNEVITKRERDFYFSVNDDYTNSLIKKGIPENKIFKQSFPTNPKIFYRDTSIKKENKIVFLGGNYNFDERFNIRKDFQEKIIKNIEKGELNFSVLEKYSLIYNIKIEDLYTWIIPAIVRRTVVKWLASLKDIQVEIYGTSDWLMFEETKPFYKGLLPYGEEMAKVYNSAKYGLVVHSQYMYQQRLCEISACDTIPVVYSSDLLQEEFNHYDNILSFSNKNEFISCINKKPLKESSQIAKDISYKKMVEKIIDLINKENNG